MAALLSIAQLHCRHQPGFASSEIRGTCMTGRNNHFSIRRVAGPQEHEQESKHILLSSSHMANDACATCASLFSNASDPMSEKPLLPGRFLECCGRSICSRCLAQNKRYEVYCPHCQISTGPSILPQGLRDPPAYSEIRNSDSRLDTTGDLDRPPAYSSSVEQRTGNEKTKTEENATDVLHFVKPDDSMRSLGLAYGVPLPVLRKTNSIYSDHLLQGRKTLLIPGDYYRGGVSLSPQPLEGEEEEVKKNKTRRFMVACKVPEYDVALLYLQQSDWDLSAAIDAHMEDEFWERNHPVESRSKAKAGKTPRNHGMRRFVGIRNDSSGG